MDIFLGTRSDCQPNASVFAKRILRVTIATIVFGLLCFAAREAAAQTATVTLGSQKQYIRGFGGMSHAAWIGDMTAAERTLAFGNGNGQLGFTVLRIPVTDGAPNALNVATAKAAIAAGAIVFATPWNAAGTMTVARFPSYADHLNNFVAYMKSQGVALYAIAVQNEPDFGTQGGWLTWTAPLCHDFVLNFGATITTKLISCESFNYNKTYFDPLLNDSIALANVQVLGTHLYGTPVNGYPYPLFDQRGAGTERWMTEHYTDSTTDANAWPNALGVATELHHAMVDAQFNLYTWWYIVRSYGPISPNGTVSKRGWCMAHFSKFIRPGFHRVDATATPAAGVLLSAYKSDTDVVVVIVNTNASAASVNVSINGSSIRSYDRFTTSATKSLANDGAITTPTGSLTVSLDAQSVTTLHGSGSLSGAGGTAGAGGSPGPGGSNGAGGSTGAGGAKSTGGFTGSAGAMGSGGAIGLGGSTGSGDGAAGGTGGGVPKLGADSGVSGDASAPDEVGIAGGCACRAVGQGSGSIPGALVTVFGVLALASRRRNLSRGRPRGTHKAAATGQALPDTRMVSAANRVKRSMIPRCPARVSRPRPRSDRDVPSAGAFVVDRVFMVPKKASKKVPKKVSKKRPRKGSDTLVLVGTVKGAFIFRSRDRRTWTRSGVLFPGMQVYALCHDPRSGRLLAGVSHPYFGTNVRYSDDLGKTWIEPKEANIKFPEDAGMVRSDVSATEPHKAKLDNVWQLVPGVEPNRIWAGVQPAALFKSDDGGKTFEMVRALWDHPHRARWNPGAGGLCLHTIVPHPTDGKTMHVAISAAGVYRTDDGGETWAAKNNGVRVDFAPEKYPEFGQCVHKIARHPSTPDRFYMQNHGGLYRSDDAGESWHDVAHGVPSDFGFSMVVHPHDADTVFIAPLNQEMRAGPGGKLRIYKTTNGAKSWKPLTRGLAQKDAYETILRDGMACDAGEPAGVYFGTRSGKVFASRDEGKSFAVIGDALPAVTCVKTGALA